MTPTNPTPYLARDHWCNGAPDALYATVILASRYPAEATLVNLPEIQAVSGVATVLTHTRLAEWVRTGRLPTHALSVIPPTVHYRFDPVALIAAVSQAALAEAVQKARITYHPLPQKPDQPPEPVTFQWHRTADRNLLATPEHYRTSVSWMPPAPPAGEPPCAFSYWDRDGTLNVVTPSLNPYRVRRRVARAIGLPKSQVVVRCMPPADLVWPDLCPLELWTSVLTWETAKPVRLSLEAQDAAHLFAPARAYTAVVQSVWTKDHLDRLEIELALDHQSLEPHSSPDLDPGLRQSFFLYQSRQYRWSTQSPLPLAEGSRLTALALETHMQWVAQEKRMTPWELRVPVLSRRGDPADFPDTPQGSVRVIHHHDLSTLMQKTVKTSWAINGPADAHEGLGIALGLRSLQSAAKGAVQVYLGIDEDGSVWLEAGAVEPRAGALDTLTGVVRTAMGLGADVPVSVRPVRTDGLLSFHDFDRGPAPTLVVAQAVLQAAKELKRRLSRIYRRLKATDSTVPAWDFSAPHRLRDLVRANQESLTPLSLIAHGTASVQGLPPALAVAAVRLRVDPATYAIQVRHIVLGLDVGRVLNHADLRIIVQDRVMRALREALWGELGPSRLTHLPPLSLIIEENPAPNGPLGAKGLGEAADAPIAPALVNGLYHATGIWMPHLPLTPERIRQSAHRALKLHPHAPPSALSGA